MKIEQIDQYVKHIQTLAFIYLLFVGIVSFNYPFSIYTQDRIPINLIPCWLILLLGAIAREYISRRIKRVKISLRKANRNRRITWKMNSLQYSNW